MNEIIFSCKSTPDFKMCLRSSCFAVILIAVLTVLHVPTVAILIGIMMLMIYISGFLLTPYRFVLTENCLSIKRYWKNIDIRCEDITEIRLMTGDDKKGLSGDWRVDGIFANYGVYSTNRHKKLHVYTRRDSNWTLIVTSEKKYAVAPDDLQLIDAVQKQKNKQRYSNYPL